MKITNNIILVFADIVLIVTSAVGARILATYMYEIVCDQGWLTYSSDLDDDLKLFYPLIFGGILTLLIIMSRLWKWAYYTDRAHSTRERIGIDLPDDKIDAIMQGEELDETKRNFFKTMSGIFIYMVLMEIIFKIF